MWVQLREADVPRPLSVSSVWFGGQIFWEQAGLMQGVGIVVTDENKYTGANYSLRSVARFSRRSCSRLSPPCSISCFRLRGRVWPLSFFCSSRMSDTGRSAVPPPQSGQSDPVHVMAPLSILPQEPGRGGGLLVTAEQGSSP